MAATCAFETLKGAVDTVIQLIQLGVPVARVEFLDEVQVRACNGDGGLGLPETPHLFFEFHGSPAGVAEQVETAAASAADHGGRAFQWAERPEDRTRLWKTRHRAYFAAAAMRPGARIWASDVLGISRWVGTHNIQVEAFEADRTVLSASAFNPRWMQTRTSVDPETGETTSRSSRAKASRASCSSCAVW